MRILEKKNMRRNSLLLALMTFLGGICTARAQEPMIGAQNGITWKNLVIGTPTETLSRKTFYVDGLDNMSSFWSQHADLKADAIDFNRVFIGMDVGQIRDRLDSFYVDEKNIQVPIIDAILVVRLENAKIDNPKVEDILKQFRKATINGPDAAREKTIWQAGLKLLK
ncbi:MAG TPA: hypothetical protein VLX91_14995 [Candidatus Acidoferrales bacterium]|nr:hypothetical protein [Candidatus Acidoferrales bacterium]